MSSSESVLPVLEERQLVLELARAAVGTTAPEELVLFEDTAAEYFADSGGALHGDRRDEAVGFGLDLALLTPAALMVATAVVQAVGGVVGTAWKDEATPVIRQWFRRLFGLEPAPAGTAAAAAPAAPLTADEARRVQTVALERALAAGVAPEQASLLADAIVGRLVTTP